MKKHYEINLHYGHNGRPTGLQRAECRSQVVVCSIAARRRCALWKHVTTIFSVYIQCQIIPAIQRNEHCGLSSRVATCTVVCKLQVDESVADNGRYTHVEEVRTVVILY